MKKQKRGARPTVGAMRRAAETAAYGRAAVPKINFTTDGAGRQTRIADLLPHGAENGINLHHLEVMTGQDGRTVRRMIEAERRVHEIIKTARAVAAAVEGAEL